MDCLKVNELMNELYINDSGSSAETGFGLLGHRCLDDKDTEMAEKTHTSLLFGEILPQGLHKMLDGDHLDIMMATTVYDLGMGLGKVALHIYLEYEHIERVVGIEMSPNRYHFAQLAARLLVTKFPEKYKLKKHIKDKYVMIEDDNDRILEFKCGNIFDEKSIKKANIVIMNTDFPKECMIDLYGLLHTLKGNAKILSFGNLKDNLLGVGKGFLAQLPINRDPDDACLTSWSPQWGHHFYLWRKTKEKSCFICK